MSFDLKRENVTVLKQACALKRLKPQCALAQVLEGLKPLDLCSCHWRMQLCRTAAEKLLWKSCDYQILLSVCHVIDDLEAAWMVGVAVIESFLQKDNYRK